jgi:hypothetical protein
MSGRWLEWVWMGLVMALAAAFRGAKTARRVGRVGVTTARRTTRMTRTTRKTSLFGDEEVAVGSDQVWVPTVRALVITIGGVAVTTVVAEARRNLVQASWT